MTNIEILNSNMFNAIIVKKLDRAVGANTFIKVTKEEAEAIYNLPNFTPNPNELKGYIMHTCTTCKKFTKQTKFQICLGYTNGNYVLWLL